MRKQARRIEGGPRSRPRTGWPAAVLAAVLLLAGGGFPGASFALDDNSETSGESETLWSLLDPQLYGYLKLDAAFDSSPTATGNFVKWVQPEGGDAGDELSLTANQTRLGLTLGETRPGSGFGAGGRVEVDFYGGGDSDPYPKLRHAYVELAWAEARTSLIVGKTSDLVSPLVPTTLNYTVAWWTGNIGFRRPQLRLSKGLAFAGAKELELAAALVHQEGDSDLFTPGLQARVGLVLPGRGGRRSVLGISGHHSREQLAPSADGAAERFTSWSLNLDLIHPLGERTSLAGELFTGANLAPYLGSIGQGAAGPDDRLPSRGGWLAARLGPWGKGHFNVGLSVEDVDDAELVAGGRTLNGSLFGNWIHAFTAKIEVGLELSFWRTEYKQQDSADCVRTQASFIYKL